MQTERSHDLARIHKQFDTFPSFRPILDTTNTSDYLTGEFLEKLLNPLTQNKYSVKDSLEIISAIHEIPVKMFDHGYGYSYLT